MKKKYRDCFYCEKTFPRQNLTIDHFIPKHSGGPNHKSNYVFACAPCNVAKGRNLPTPKQIRKFKKMKGYFPGGSKGRRLLEAALSPLDPVKQTVSNSSRVYLRIENMVRTAQHNTRGWIDNRMEEMRAA